MYFSNATSSLRLHLPIIHDNISLLLITNHSQNDSHWKCFRFGPIFKRNQTSLSRINSIGIREIYRDRMHASQMERVSHITQTRSSILMDLNLPLHQVEYGFFGRKYEFHGQLQQ